ncbi:hypothetical protein ZYGR_0P03480 [Zygosaccharomyces rouxii]|uniref:ZYRO0E08536p n=2 Tax=Zygosaccharomyces rouxii TaxID=4956 RepID=C5E4T1_ZYGRC|nr:uncharacterized protein ZYRO0E08536g [Zygosaccharomyces rouxii]KAH9198102.1 hypothetical protein LQ764DRAFT_236039 [Zygosaccharomyces rouxii]GAV49702.1 hypothetical protein ZYGR_0P03480 [Zygosaccharomyces rouxii]CAR31042.1 ZYRO0E08536p [Zygosaccharomyces rouxii]
MRSFIRSHKKANSLDENPTGFAPPHSNNEGLTAPDMPKNDTVSFIQSTPPQSGSNFQGFKHSPGFESFHKLNKKMFPGKLFKKNSSSNSPLLQPGPFGPKEYSSAPGTPQANKYEMPGDVGMGRNSHDDNRFLAVKGTVTHSWGDNGDKEQQVIVLNNNNNNNNDNDSNDNNNNNGSNHSGKFQSSTQPSTPVLSSDLGPAVRIASERKAQEAPPRSFQLPGYAPRSSTEDGSLRQGEQQQPQVYSKLSSVKNKNRQARIHSHDDILHLGQDSSVTMDFLKSTFSPDTLDEDSPDMRTLNDDNGDEATAKVNNTSKLSNFKGPDNVTKRSPAVKFQEDHGASQDVEVGDTEHLPPEEEDYEEDEEYEEDDEEDATSRFSFEISGINGRTSSVKYYSKPEPSEAMYIDDLYEDENFDDDLNCFEDEDGEMEFPSNLLGISDNSDNESVVKKDLTPDDAHLSEPKPVKKYQDLFALSDEEEEDGADHSGLAGLGLDTKTINVSAQSFASNEKRPLSSVPSSARHSKHMESTEKDQKSSPTNLNDSRTSDSFNHDTTMRSPSASQSTTTVCSQAPLQTSPHIQSSPTMSMPSIRLQSPSTIKPPATNKPPRYHASPGAQSPLDVQPSIPALSGKQPSLPKSKAVKSFSDIFDLEDGLSDEDEDQDDLIGEVNAAEDGSFSIPDRESPNASDDSQQRKYLQMHTSPLGRPKTPVQIYLTPPGNSASTSVTPFDSQPHLSNTTPSLPPPARSQSLKYHDLSSNLDSEIPGLMSNLYFIDEKEEDKYMEEHKLADDDYLDEINTVPEDFTFSDSEHDDPAKPSLRRSLRGSFRGTHSYSSQPTGTAKENAPARNKLEIKNKTVTFFNHGWDRSPIDKYQRSPRTSEQYLDSIDDYITSPSKADYENFAPLTPNNSVNKPSPGFINDKSLSPIQEGSSSVDNSPKIPSLR